MLLYSLIPSSKERVVLAPLPAEPTVSIAEIRETLQPTTAAAQEAKALLEEEPPPQPSTPPPDPLAVRLAGLLDTLRLWVPNDWEPTYARRAVEFDYLNRPIRWAEVFVKRGLKQQVTDLLKLYDDKEKKIRLVFSMIYFASQFDDTMRVDAVRAFMKLTRSKHQEYQETVAMIQADNREKEQRANSDYNAARARKEFSRQASLIRLGSSFVGVAIFGLFLCFLAIERNTRAIRDLIQPPKPPLPEI